METQEQIFPYAQQCLCWSWSNRSDPPKLKKGKGRQGGKGGRSGQGKGHGSGQTNSGQVSLEKNPTDEPRSRFPQRTPSCLYCKAKQKPASAQGHWLDQCHSVTAVARQEITQLLPDVCLGCLRKKRSNLVHKCPDYMKKASNSEGTFCASCKCHRKLCTSPNLHQAVTLPESFAGAGLMETEYTLVASSVVASSSPWPQQVLNKEG